MKVGAGSSVIQTKQLTVGYERQQGNNLLFENLNLQLRSGQLTCFMGPNGIGKSTLIRTLAGLQKPQSGQVLYTDGLQPSPYSTALPKNVAVVLTDRITAVTMNVYEIVSFGRYPYVGWGTTLSTDDKQIIQRSIDQVQIRHLMPQKVYELSDGQLQMVMIARALAQDTPIILLDEPTAHLDLNNRLEIMNLLRNLVRTLNKAILVATHELDLALQTADVIWLAGRHRNILTGIPEDLVLNGAFDEIFQFKGFDLKTGKVHHEVHRRETIRLLGKGHEYLWTKNALARSGYSLAEVNATHTIAVVNEANNNTWLVDDTHQFESINALLVHLNKRTAT